MQPFFGKKKPKLRFCIFQVSKFKKWFKQQHVKAKNKKQNTKQSQENNRVITTQIHTYSDQKELFTFEYSRMDVHLSWFWMIFYTKEYQCWSSLFLFLNLLARCYRLVRSTVNEQGVSLLNSTFSSREELQWFQLRFLQEQW